MNTAHPVPPAPTPLRPAPRSRSPVRPLLGLGAALALLAGCVGPRGREPIHAIWVTRSDYKTAEDVTDIMDRCADAGINTVFFQVRGNGTAFYKSSYEPWAEQFGFQDPGFDPLAVACRSAHARRLVLHAWVNVLPAWRGTEPPAHPEQLYHTHPEWFWYDQHGQRQALSSFYVSLNPCLPEVRAYLVEVFREILANYDVDGLHLDYIRFPNEPPATPRGSDIDYPYDARTLALYRADTGLAPGDDRARWDRWRTDQVTTLVCQIHEMLQRTRPAAQLSASVGSVRANALRHFQDARRWMELGCIDVLCLMNYTDDPAQFAERIDPWLADRPDVPIVPGLWFGRHRGKSPQDATAAVIEQVRIAVQKTGNYCLFSYASLFGPRGADDETLATRTRPESMRQVRQDMLLPVLKELAARAD